MARRLIPPILTRVITALAITLAVALGQDPFGDPAALRLERVEQGFEDVSPLAISLQQPGPEFRAPVGWDAVYRVPGSDGLLMRQSGAVRAVFDRSEYAATRFGQEALVPAGTIYAIGEPDEALLQSLAGRTGRSLVSGGEQSPLPPSDLRVSNRLTSEFDPAPAPPRPSRAAEPLEITVWTSDAVRRARVASLLEALREDSSEPAPPADN